jgi:hypothetical protein
LRSILASNFPSFHRARIGRAARFSLPTSRDPLDHRDDGGASMTFEAGPVNPQPHAINLFGTPNDPAAVLPEAAAVKMIALHQRVVDAHAAIPAFDSIREASLAIAGHRNRINDLMRRKAEGGFGLPPDAPQLLDERGKLERAEQELSRLNSLNEIRSARWNTVAGLERSITDWIMRGGIPGGCVLEAVADAPISELLSKNDGGRLDAAVERYRHRLRELAADLHRVRSAPWPSSVAKAAARAQIEALAASAAPDIDRAIEHGLPISFATTVRTTLVRGTDKPATVAIEATDAVGLLCWVLRDELLAKINAALDEAADDKAALSQQQREEMEAQIMHDVLMIERSEVACIWAAEAQGAVIDFRGDTSPQSLLGVRLVAAPRAVPSPDSNARHAYELVGGRRR